MSRYIDADKLKQDLDAWAINLHKPTNLVREDTFVIIDEQPAADVVEVVRCKDCKWWDGIECKTRDIDVVDVDDFCSYGERKDGEKDECK